VELLAAPKAGRPAVAQGKELGFHPIDNKPVVLMTGKYGPYVKHGNVNATVPSDMKAEELTLDDAVDLLAERAARELAKSGSTARPVVTTMRAAAAARAPRKGQSGAQRGGGGARGGAAAGERGRAATPQAKPGRPGGGKPGARRGAPPRGGNQASAGTAGGRRRGR
jgi:DNA topoisomerase-1